MEETTTDRRKKREEAVVCTISFLYLFWAWHCEHIARHISESEAYEMALLGNSEIGDNLFVCLAWSLRSHDFVTFLATGGSVRRN